MNTNLVMASPAPRGAIQLINTSPDCGIRDDKQVLFISSTGANPSSTGMEKAMRSNLVMAKPAWRAVAIQLDLHIPGLRDS